MLVLPQSLRTARQVLPYRIQCGFHIRLRWFADEVTANASRLHLLCTYGAFVVPVARCAGFGMHVVPLRVSAVRRQSGLAKCGAAAGHLKNRVTVDPVIAAD